jgi:hypothetical protein
LVMFTAKLTFLFRLWLLFMRRREEDAQNVMREKQMDELRTAVAGHAKG